MLADVVVLVEDLALEVREVDDVEVDDADRADAGEREVERRRAAEAARADDQHLRLHELALTDGADLRHDDVPAVAVDLLRREGDLAAGDGGDHGHLVAVVHGRVLALEGVDLLAVDVDVDVAGNLVRLVVDHVLERRVGLAERVEHLAHGLAFRLHVGLVPREAPERRRYVHHH